MEFDPRDKIELANCIADEIRKEFKDIHFSYNLVRTMKIEINGNDVSIDIPAMKFNIKQYKLHRVIKYYYRGSYANLINYTGGFSGRHQDYIQRCMENGISKWLAQKGKQGRISINE